MRKLSLSFYTLVFAVSLSLVSCQRSSGSAWEDTKTLGRYIKKGTQKLLGQYNDSRMLYDSDDFLGPIEDEYIPLSEKDSKSVASKASMQKDRSFPKETTVPSADESKIPNIDSFKTPTDHLANIFKLVHFHTDDHVLREKEYLSIVDHVVNHMKKNPKVFVFVLGHCDERASEAYNLALGTRRANHVRTLLVKKGVNPNHVFTISFGKEIPLDLGHGKSAWAKNRRVEFKIYEKTQQL